MSILECILIVRQEQNLYAEENEGAIHYLVSGVGVSSCHGSLDNACKFS